MPPKAYYLSKDDSIQVIKNVRTSSSDLVERVLAEETTYENEAKKLISYNEEEFYSRRDKLIDALNLYEHWDIGPQIGEMDKDNLDYTQFHSELKELKKKKLNLTLKATGIVLGTAGLLTFAFAGMVTGLAITGLFGYLGGMGISGGATLIGNRISLNSKNFLPDHSALRSYASILRKSQSADGFTRDIPFLEGIYPIKYEDSEISKLYENNAKRFIDYFSSLEEDGKKEGILRLLYDSEHRNEEVISWLDENEPELIKKVGLNL